MIPKDEDKELTLKYKVEGECLTIFVSQSVSEKPLLVLYK